MTTEQPQQNLGWTLQARTYHAVHWGQAISKWGYVYSSEHAWRPQCKIWPDIKQTTLLASGEPTGTPVPTDLRPCKRCFPRSG